MYRIRPWLYIGKFVETTSYPILKVNGITAMLQLAAAVKQPGIASLFMPISDGEPIPLEKIEQGVNFIRQQKAADKVVLSACAAGISRSTTFAMAALMAEESLGLFDAYREVYAHHVEAMPHPELLRSLAAYYKLQVLTVPAIYQRIMDIHKEMS